MVTGHSGAGVSSEGVGAAVVVVISHYSVAIGVSEERASLQHSILSKKLSSNNDGLLLLPYDNFF